MPQISNFSLDFHNIHYHKFPFYVLSMVAQLQYVLDTFSFLALSFYILSDIKYPFWERLHNPQHKTICSPVGSQVWGQ